MNKSKKAKIVAVIGLIGMFLFPSPERNFVYYLGWILLNILIILYIMNKKEKPKCETLN